MMLALAWVIDYVCALAPYNAILFPAGGSITIGMLLIERRRKQHYLRLQKELQRNQAKIYKMYESIEENGNSSPHSREEILAIYRDSLNASIALFNKSACAKRLQGLNKLRNKDVGHISIKEREELYKTLDENFITVITYLRDEADKYSQAPSLAHRTP